jgi:hypothetical protein
MIRNVAECLRLQLDGVVADDASLAAIAVPAAPDGEANALDYAEGYSIAARGEGATVREPIPWCATPQVVVAERWQGASGRV